jgi:hypothetical protein
VVVEMAQVTAAVAVEVQVAVVHLVLAATQVALVVLAQQTQLLVHL